MFQKMAFETQSKLMTPPPAFDSQKKTPPYSVINLTSRGLSARTIKPAEGIHHLCRIWAPQRCKAGHKIRSGP